MLMNIEDAFASWRIAVRRS